MTDNAITLTQNDKKIIRAFRNIEKAKAYEFLEIVKRAYKPNPARKDIQELRKWLDEYPEIWVFVFDVAENIEKNIIKRMMPEQATHLALEKNLDEIKRDLGYEEATVMERMLIDNIVVSWLRCQYAEYQLIAWMGQRGASISVIAFWEKRLSAAQGRYLRACETLAKIRKLSLRDPLLQVNIATQSGQQVNVAGDLVKK